MSRLEITRLADRVLSLVILAIIVAATLAVGGIA